MPNREFPFTPIKKSIYKTPQTTPHSTVRKQIMREDHSQMSNYRTGRIPKYIPGYKFGELTLLSRYGNRAILECSCGNVIEVSIPALTTGGKSDCGHVAAERDLETVTNQSRDMLYWTWRNMLNRCEDPYNPDYKNYGGAGVTIYGPWHDFEKFKSDLGTRPFGTSLDRIDPYGNYEPSNCRWATVHEQAHNKRQRKPRADGVDLTKE